jgi:hypothetical protein
MGADRYSIEYHLTPRGWIAGTSTHFGIADNVVAPPSDRVETWLKYAEQRPGWPSEDVSWSRVWRDPTKSDQDKKALRARFAAPRNFPADQILGTCAGCAALTSAFPTATEVENHYMSNTEKPSVSTRTLNHFPTRAALGFSDWSEGHRSRSRDYQSDTHESC